MIRSHLPPLVSGTLFGAGLALGGMTNPERVRGFLDVFGNWDPTLAFVMGGAVLVMAVAWRFVPRMKHPLFAPKFALPDRNDLTPQLIGGAAIFGVGWGLAGLCPGPGVAILFVHPLEAAVFVVSLLAGMVLQRLVSERASPAASS